MTCKQNLKITKGKSGGHILHRKIQICINWDLTTQVFFIYIIDGNSERQDVSETQK